MDRVKARRYAGERREDVLLRVRDVPVDGREMLALSELLVQSPEDLNDTERCRRDRVREVTTGRRDAAEAERSQYLFERSEGRKAKLTRR
jgi:hypothetical protein